MTGEHGLLDAARNGGQDAFARVVAPVPGPASGLLPSNAEAPFRAGHGAMDFGAGPDQYLQSNRSIQRAAAARLSQRKTSVVA